MKQSNERDVFFLNRLPAAYNGAFAEVIDFVGRTQIKDRTLWHRFVRQFTFPADDPNHGWRCEYWGKMMRGAAAICDYTKDDELYQILSDSVRELLKTQAPDGRISSYSREKAFSGWDMWGRKYVLLALSHFLEICRDDAFIKEIEDAMCHMLDEIIRNVGPDSGKKKITETSSHWLGANSCSILEPVVLLYRRTGKEAYLTFASYLVDAASGGEGPLDIFRAAEEDRLIPSEYCETKAYETMSCFEGLIEYYRVTGEERYKNAALRFGRRVLESEYSVIGSAGCTHELFDNTRLHEVDPAFDGIMQETCVSVTMMKFFGQLLRLSGDSAYADAMEITFWNAFLGAMNTEQNPTVVLDKEGKEHSGILPFDSYSPLRAGFRGRKVGGLMYLDDGSFYGCCACISPIAPGILPRYASMPSRDGVAFQFYFPGESRVRTPGGQILHVKTETGYPYTDLIRLTFSLDRAESFPILFRIPLWSRENSLSVNGEEVPAEKGYTRVCRLWKTGDCVELRFDLRPTAVLPDSASPYRDAYRAVRVGAIRLAADSRLGVDPEKPIRLAFDETGHLPAVEVPSPEVPEAKLCLSFPTADGKSVRLIDCASAGKGWKEEEKHAVWLLTGRDASDC